MAEQQAACPGCGHPMDESMALDDRGRPLHEWQGRSSRCEACAAVDEEQRRIRRDSGGSESAMDGRRFWAERVTD